MDRTKIANTIRKWYETREAVQCVKEGACQYRGPGGTRCFIGILIPDRLIHHLSSLDMTLGIGGILPSNVAIYEYLEVKYGELDIQALGALQQLHDSYGDTSTTPRVLRPGVFAVLDSWENRKGIYA